MGRYILLVAGIAVMLVACPKIESGSGSTSTTTQNSDITGFASTDTKANVVQPGEAVVDAVQRGYDIFHTTEYSHTSLACANCHADSERTDEERIYIASSGHGAFSRGAWRIMSETQLEAGEGDATSLIDAANMCIKAPYMNHTEQLIEGTDADALVAYLENIATDEEAFLVSSPTSMPVGGLMYDEERGHEIYRIACRNCHDIGLPGVPELAGANEWLNTLQIIAKIRSIGDDYYGEWENLEYEDFEKDAVITLEEQANTSDDSTDVSDDDEMFEDGAMPFFTTNSLSDQQLVDVGTFVSTIL